MQIYREGGLSRRRGLRCPKIGFGQSWTNRCLRIGFGQFWTNGCLKIGLEQLLTNWCTKKVWCSFGQIGAQNLFWAGWFKLAQKYGLNHPCPKLANPKVYTTQVTGSSHTNTGRYNVPFVSTCVIGFMQV